MAIGLICIMTYVFDAMAKQGNSGIKGQEKSNDTEANLFP